MKLDYPKSWIIQKVTALLFLFLLVFTLFSLSKVNLESHFEIVNWFSNFFNFISFSILFTSIVIHSKLGLNSIIDDYIHNNQIKKKILFLKNTFLITIYLLVIGCLLHMVK